jgi:outer membrane receptor protein involved in Fe transport
MRSDPVSAAFDFVVDQKTSAATWPRQGELETWLSQRPEHRAAHQSVERYWQGLDGLQAWLPRDRYAALGTELRRQVFNSADSTDVSGTRARYERRVAALFGELNLPLMGGEWSFRGLRDLDLSISARYEHYSDFPHSMVPLLALRWTPFQGLEVRTTWGRSLQAPNLAELDESQNTIVMTSLPDSSAPSGASEALVLSGNRASLKEQTATTISLSIDFQRKVGPWTWLAAVSYFDVDFSGRIGAADFAQLSLGDSRLAGLIERNPTSALQRQLCMSVRFYGDAATCLKSAIAAVVDARERNSGTLLTRGLFFEAASDMDLAWGTIDTQLNGTYLLEYAESVTPLAAPVSSLNTIYNPLRLKLQGSLAVQRRNVTLSIRANFSNRYWDNLSVPARPIASWTTLDLTWTYEVPGDSAGWLKGMSVLLAAQNVFDHGPPAVANHLENERYDAENAYPLGRTASVRLQKKW